MPTSTAKARQMGETCPIPLDAFTRNVLGRSFDGAASCLLASKLIGSGGTDSSCLARRYVSDWGSVFDDAQTARPALGGICSMSDRIAMRLPPSTNSRADGPRRPLLLSAFFFASIRCESRVFLRPNFYPFRLVRAG